MQRDTHASCQSLDGEGEITNDLAEVSLGQRDRRYPCAFRLIHSWLAFRFKSCPTWLPWTKEEHESVSKRTTTTTAQAKSYPTEAVQEKNPHMDLQQRKEWLKEHIPMLRSCGSLKQLPSKSKFSNVSFCMRASINWAVASEDRPILRQCRLCKDKRQSRKHKAR